MDSLEQALASVPIVRDTPKTYSEAFVYNIQRACSKGAEYISREIAMPIYESTMSDEQTERFLIKAGIMSRDPSYNLEVTTEKQGSVGLDETPTNVLLLVFKPNENTDVERIRKFMEEDN